MTRRAWPCLLSLVLLVSACRSDSTGADTRRYACRQDDECATGFVCRAGMCQGGSGPVTPPGDGGASEDPDAGAPTDGGIPDGGGTSDGGGTPAASRLGFVLPAQTVDTGQCVAMGVETQTAAGAPSPVGSATAISLSTQPPLGVGLFRDAACATATGSVTVEPGASRATFFFRGTTAQTVRLGASASGFEPVEQDVTVRAGPANVVFVSAAQTLPAGGCSGLIELEARDSGARATFFSTSREVTLSGTDLTFYSNAACTTPLSNPVFAANTTRFSFFFKGKRGGTVRLSAQVSGVAQVSQDQTVLPAVRKSLCKLPADRYAVQCSFPSGMPPQLELTKTLLLFQASPDGTSPSSGAVRCWLSAKDAVTCGRNSLGAIDIDIYWQTLELPTGLRVQHLEMNCTSGNPIVRIPISPVTPGKSFLLTSSELGGNILGEDDFFTAKLADSGSQVELQFSTGCNSAWKGRLQVVEMDGLQVTRGTASMTGTQTQTGALVQNTDLASSVLLFTYRVSNAGSVNVCDRAVRGDLTTSSLIAFTRGAGNSSRCTAAAIDEIAWERITFGPLARVQTLLVDILPGTDIARPTFNEVDLTRSVVFASGQAMNGPSGGETSYAGDDILAEFLASSSFLSPTQLYVNRVSDEGRGRWTQYVVQFEP